MERETLVINTLVELADNLVDNYDVIDNLTVLSDRCVQAVDVTAAGVMLALPGGSLQYIASSSESMKNLELFQIQANEGPCVDCYANGVAIVNHELNVEGGKWPRFTPQALAQGYHSVHCLPMRLRGRRIGALNLFRDEVGVLSSEDAVVAQGFADVATIAILQHQNSITTHLLTEQLSFALNSRIIIEQAKGMVSQSTGCDIDEAFSRLRTYSRNHNLRLTDVASSVVRGLLLVDDLARVVK